LVMTSVRGSRNTTCLAGRLSHMRAGMRSLGPVSGELRSTLCSDRGWT
jgi:hypothetical protein